MKQIVREQLDKTISVLERVRADDALLGDLAAAAEATAAALLKGRKLMVAGNGGSAADAQHIAAELVGRFAFERPALPALALSVNASCITAIGNDYGYEEIFARQLKALANPGDVAVAISTSGNSPNVIQAVLSARGLGLFTIGISGTSGGRLRDLVDVLIAAPSEETPRIQECHILLGHALCDAIEQAVCAEP